MKLIHELNWIPTFGSGCIYQPSEVMAMPVARLERLIDLIIEQREDEARQLAKKR